MMKKSILLSFFIAFCIVLSGCYQANVSDNRQFYQSDSAPTIKATSVINDTPSPTKSSIDNTPSANPTKTLLEKRTPAPKPTIIATPAPKPTGVNRDQDNTDSSIMLRFIVMADSRGSDKGINSQVVKKIMGRIKSLSPQPEFAVMPGDLVDGAKTYAQLKAQLQYFKNTVTQFYPADFFYPGFGNHEARAGTESGKAFSEVFSDFNASVLEGYNRTVYYFDRGSARFFMLNSNHPGENHMVSESQLGWLKSNIDNSKKHNFFFIHEPPFPTGSGVGNSLDRIPLSRNKLWKVVDSSKSPMFFCGHEHYYTRRHIDKSFNSVVDDIKFEFEKTVYQVTVGSFGAPLYNHYTSKKNVDVPPISQYHFSVVDITSGGISVNVYNIEGKLIDSFKQGS